MFQRSPYLVAGINLVDLFRVWKQHKYNCPTYGAIILNPEMTKVGLIGEEGEGIVKEGKDRGRGKVGKRRCKVQEGQNSGGKSKNRWKRTIY